MELFIWILNNCTVVQLPTVKQLQRSFAFTVLVKHQLFSLLKNTLTWVTGLVPLFSFFIPVGESAPVVFGGCGVDGILAPGETCMLASWAAYSCWKTRRYTYIPAIFLKKAAVNVLFPFFFFFPLVFLLLKDLFQLLFVASLSAICKKRKNKVWKTPKHQYIFSSFDFCWFFLIYFFPSC